MIVMIVNTTAQWIIILIIIIIIITLVVHARCGTYVRTHVYRTRWCRCIITVCALDLFINLYIHLSLSFGHYQHTHTNTTLLATGAFLSSGSGEKVRKRGRYPCVAQHVYCAFHSPKWKTTFRMRCWNVFRSV